MKGRISRIVALCLILCNVSSASAGTLVIPKGTEIIEAEAFYCDRGIDEVILPEGLKRIGERAFAGLSLTSINLPSSLEYIADNAFENTDIERTTASGESYSHQWAEDNDYEVIDSDSPFEDQYWMVFYEGFRNGRLEASTFNSTLDPSELKLVWNTNVQINNKAGSTRVKQYYLNENNEWVSIGTYGRLTDKATGVIGSNLDVVSSSGSVLSPATSYSAILPTLLEYVDNLKNSQTQQQVVGPTHYLGEPHTFRGYYKPDEQIESVRATIKSDTGEVIEQIEGEVHNIWVPYSVFTDVLHFENLELGNYQFTIEVKMDGSGVWQTVVDNTFEVILSKPASYHSKDLSVPNGLIAVGTSFKGVGTIRANRSIDAIQILVTTDDDAETHIRDYSLTPESLSVSMAEVLADLHTESLPAGAYRFRMLIVSGENTWLAAETRFQMFNYDQQLGEENTKAIISWCLNADNRYVFDSYRDYADYLRELDSGDTWIMAISNYSDIIRDNLISWFTGSGTDGFVVKLYKKAILDMLGSLDASVIKNDASFNSFEKKILTLTKDISKTGSITSGVFLANIDSYIGDLQKKYDGLSKSDAVKIQRYLCQDEISYFKDLKSKFKKLGTTAKIVGYTKDALEIIALATTDYQQNMEALASLANAYGDSPTAEFTEALKEIMSEYQDGSLVIITELCERLEELVMDEFVGVVEDGIVTLTQAGLQTLGWGGQTISLTYSLAKFVTDKLIKYTVADIAEDDYDFLTIMNLMLESTRAYDRSFDKVSGGDTTSDALKEVLFSFQATKYATVKMYEFLTEHDKDSADYYRRKRNEVYAFKIVD